MLGTMQESPTQVDFLIPDQRIAQGGLASRLLNNQLDLGAMRPYITKKGRGRFDKCVGFDPAGKPKFKSFATNDATLRYDDWKLIDDTVTEVVKPRLSLIRLLESRGLTYRLPNGMGDVMLQSQQMGDITPATVSMSPVRESESDRPTFATVNFPLPLIHKDFQFDLRQVLASRKSGAGLDLLTARLAARRVAELAEQFAYGTTSSPFVDGAASYTFGGSTVYGLLNTPLRITYSITLPTTLGWTPDVTVNEILIMRGLLKAKFRYGPYLVMMGQSWDPYLDDDYKPTYNATTLRDRIKAIQGIEDVITPDYLTGYSIVIVELESGTIRLVKGMDITTVLWETHGGFMLNFKIICLIVPQIRGDINGSTGVLVGS